MLLAQPADAATASPHDAPKKSARGAKSFARALGEGLVDIAFAFDGAFRPFGSLSLAERAAYGMRPHEQLGVLRTTSSPSHATPDISRDRQVVSRPRRLLDAAQRVIGQARTAIAASPAARVEEVRREARLRHASSSDAPRRAHSNEATRFPVVRVAANVGPARLDVVIAGGGRLMSVMQWMR